MRIVRATRERGGAGVDIKCALGHPQLEHLDPFLRLAHFGAERAGDDIGGFPDHPHRGFETITYMLAGRMRHRDNKGNSGELAPGGAQRMTAGRGIVHSEMPQQESGRMSGIQLWLNLPASQKMCAPRYHDVSAEEIPQVNHADGARVKVLCGTYEGVVGPLGAEPMFLDVLLAAGSKLALALPADHCGFAYMLEGEARMGDEGAIIEEEHVAVLPERSGILTRAETRPARFLLLAGKPLREPVVHYGPFVMNTAEEIHQAIADFQAGRF
jgi:quercetin 2,3-dioxygenase